MWINTTMWSWTRWWKKEANWCGPSPDGEEKSGVREDLDTQVNQIYINLLDKIIASCFFLFSKYHVNKPILEYESSVFHVWFYRVECTRVEHQQPLGIWGLKERLFFLWDAFIFEFSSLLGSRWCDILHVAYQSTLKALLNCIWTSHTILHWNPSYLKR